MRKMSYKERLKCEKRPYATRNIIVETAKLVRDNGVFDEMSVSVKSFKGEKRTMYKLYAGARLIESYKDLGNAKHCFEKEVRRMMSRGWVVLNNKRFND